MKILLVGAGGREHALAWRLLQSASCAKLYVAPGNPGIAEIAECVPIELTNVSGLEAVACERGADLVIVGPEAPLTAGLADRLRAQGIPVFGPGQAGARLEGSKAFMKDLCARHGIPTAAYGRFTDLQEAEAFIRAQGAPIVVKADGLAAGKGVVVAETVEEAVAAAREMLSGDAFGGAGEMIVIEEFLDGEELSFFALTDGEDVVAFGTAQDHKRVYDGDQGPNTGGMGAYSPARLADAAMEARIMDEIIRPTVSALKAEGIPYRGVLFAGIMVVGGKPWLLEYNVRFGDPECQELMRRFEGDLAAVALAVAEGRLPSARDEASKWSSEPAIGVVMAAKGYPGDHVRNTPISEIDRANAVPGVVVFHAGTRLDEEGALVSSGGRVLTVTARGATLQAARDAAYQGVAAVNWPEGFCRHDIGWRALSA